MVNITDKRGYNMTVVAIACKDFEFMYRSYTAHKVNEKKADKIVELLNAAVLFCKEYAKKNCK